MGSALDELTDKQRIFVVEYAADLDKRRAIREAGYKGNDNVLRARANNLLADSKIKAALAEIGTKFDAGMLTIENITKQLVRFLFRNLAEFVDNDGYLKCDLTNLPEDVQQCVESFETDNRYDKEGNLDSQKIKVKFVSKIKALELAMKYKQMLSGDVNVNVDARNQQFNFDWKQFYNAPPNVVEDKMREILDG